jgi:hypothetical protein
MIGLYVLAMMGIAMVLLVNDGIALAVSFYGAALLPCIAVAGAKWGSLKGDGQQKISVPLIGVVLLGIVVLAFDRHQRPTAWLRL